MAARHVDDVPDPVRLPDPPHELADREWLRVLHGTADGAPTTTAIPQVPTALMPTLPVQRAAEAPPADQSWLHVESIRGPRRARPFPAVLAAVAGLVLGVAASEPFRALAAVVADLARDLTGGA
jgi:hypothetical protein